MAYNTKNILRSGDASPIPIPQFYNPTEDAFNPLTGANLGSGRYGADGVMWGKTAGGVYIPVQVNANGEVLTQLSGSKMELYGASLDDRPDPTTVPVGASFTIVYTSETWLSNGTTWVVF